MAWMDGWEQIERLLKKQLSHEKFQEWIGMVTDWLVTD